MKKLTLILMASSFCLFSCKTNSIASNFATVGNEGWKVTLYHYVDGVKITENGTDLPIVGGAYAGHKKAGYAAASNGSNGSNYYTKGIQLDKSSPTHVVTVEKDGKTATQTFDKKSKAFMDVTALLGQSQPMSFTDLQNEFVKNQSKKKKK